jgi:hypothetical protein
MICVANANGVRFGGNPGVANIYIIVACGIAASEKT